MNSIWLLPSKIQCRNINSYNILLSVGPVAGDGNGFQELKIQLLFLSKLEVNSWYIYSVFLRTNVYLARAGCHAPVVAWASERNNYSTEHIATRDKT